MAKLARRGFIKQATIGVASAGVLAGVFAGGARFGAASPHFASAATDLSATKLSGPLVAYVHDLAKGEISVMVGKREVIIRDPDLALRLATAAK